MKRIFISILTVIFTFSSATLSFAQQAVPPSAMPGADNKISLDIKGMDILDVFKILSMRSNLNIVAGKNVRGNVTMFLKDVDVWDVFEIILAANDLAYEKRGNIINVMTQRDYELIYGEKYEDRREVKTVKIKYARVEDILAALNQIKTNIGKVVADESSKSVVLMDVPYKIKEMEKIIESLDTPVITKVYELKYAKVADLKDKITEMLTKNIGSARIDQRTSKIAITDTERKIAEFDNVMAAFDEKHREVDIEAMILELTLNEQYRMGVDWDVAFQNLDKFLSRTLGDHVFSFNFPQTLATGTTYRIGDVGTKGFQAVVEFLQEYGHTKILSNPRVTVLNNEEAKILVGKNQPYVTTTQSQGDTTTVATANVTYLDLGVKLTVTPAINKDGFITMKVKPEVSSSSTNVEYSIAAGVTNTVPVVETSSTETIVMVKDGHSIMLSGLIQKRDEVDEKKVPGGISNIPFLGNLFKSTRHGNTSEPERKEIIVFLTPRIVNGESVRNVDEIKANRLVEKQQQQELEERLHQKIMDEELLKVKPEQLQARPLVWDRGMNPQDYYKLIRQSVNERIAANKPQRPLAGEVAVSFIVTSDGALAEEPKFYTLGNAGSDLVQIALRCIKEAAPFPPFPVTIKKDNEIFNITISYE